jgi:O-antigen ligase
MIWLLGGYIWLYVHRPFEIWPALGALQVERGYMLVMLLVWFVAPGKGLVSNRIHLAQAFFGLALIITWITSPYASMPGAIEVVENYFKVAVFYVLVITSVRDERGLRLLVMIFLSAFALYMIHSLWEYLHGRYQWRMGTSRMMGVDSTYSDPNAFASTILYSLPFILPFWNEHPRRVPRWMLLGYILLVVCCILLTGSRAGFAGLCLLGCILLYSASKRKLQTLMLGGLCGLFGLLFLSVVLPQDLQNRYLTIIDSSRGPTNAQESAQGRIDGIVLGLHLWQQSPIVGYGPGSFAHGTGKGLQAHNLYGQAMSEMGSLGVFALIAVLWCFWRNYRESWRRWQACGANAFSYQISRSVGINVILLLVMGCAGHNLFRYNWQWFAAFGAIALHCLRQAVLSESEIELSEPSLDIDGSYLLLPYEG